MFASYIDQAMELARYEIIEDEGTYWGEIPGLQGVWARYRTLEGCRRELREALSDWIALRLRLGLTIPILAGIDLNQILQPGEIRILPGPAAGERVGTALGWNAFRTLGDEATPGQLPDAAVPTFTLTKRTMPVIIVVQSYTR